VEICSIGIWAVIIKIKSPGETRVPYLPSQLQPP
jgi:hypothetical protein